MIKIIFTAEADMKNNNTYNLVLTALMIAMVMVLTYIIKIPVPATEGYIHLGDTMIFFSVLLLGWKRGAIASGVGSALADLIGGYMHYVPVTFIVKTLMAIAMGLCIDYAIKKGYVGNKMRAFEILGMIIAGLVMVTGYYLAEGFMYGNFIVPLAAIPMNIVQFVSGVILATAISGALYKTPVRKNFTYKLDEVN